MNALLSITAPVFLIIALGYMCARAGAFKAEAQKSLGFFVFYCAMPAYLFLAMAKVPRSMIINTDYVFAFAISMALTAALAGLLTRAAYKRDGPSTILAMMSACYTNSAFIGIPIIVMAFGNASFVVIITLFQVIVVTTSILAGIEIFQKHGLISLNALTEFPKTILLNPIVGGSLLGIIFALLSWSVPSTIERALQLLGNAGIPTALFALGLSLAEKRSALSLSARTLVYLLVVLKVIIQPLLAWLAGRYLFHLPDPWLGALTIIAAMPTAVNNYIFAQRYNSFVDEASQAVFLSSVFSVVTLSGLLWFFGAGQ